MAWYGAGNELMIKLMTVASGKLHDLPSKVAPDFNCHHLSYGWIAREQLSRDMSFSPAPQRNRGSRATKPNSQNVNKRIERGRVDQHIRHTDDQLCRDFPTLMQSAVSTLEFRSTSQLKHVRRLRPGNSCSPRQQAVSRRVSASRRTHVARHYAGEHGNRF